jgi:hypothetical protein
MPTTKKRKPATAPKRAWAEAMSEEYVVHTKYGWRRYVFAIVCRVHNAAEIKESFEDPEAAVRYVDGLSVTDCGEDAVMLAVDPGISARQVAATPAAMRAILEADLSRRVRREP